MMGEKTSEQLTVGEVYTRADLSRMFDIHDATLRTGIFQPKDTDSVWLFVTENKTPDRTQYNDRLDGDRLDWDSQPTGRKDHLILNHRRLGLELLLFYRAKKSQYPGWGFRYEGPFDYVSHSGSGPAHFILQRAAAGPVPVIYPDEVPTTTRLVEGAARQVTVNAYERNPAAREACIRHYGTQCFVCGFNFGRVYGPLGAGFIHVHHLRQLSEIGERYVVDPIQDLRPVCPNCHAMLHRTTPPQDIKALTKTVRQHARR